MKWRHKGLEPDDVFTEEGMTRLRNFNRRAAGYMAFWLMVAAVVVAGLIWVKVNYQLKPLQRIYLVSYVAAAVKATVSKSSQGKYVLLVRTEVDPPTSKDAFLRVTDEQTEPVVDEDGGIKRDPKRGLVFALKAGVPAKHFFWRTGRGSDRVMYQWMRGDIYDGQGLLGLTASALITGGMIFGSGLWVTIARDRRANKRYEQGRQIRGTRLQSPREYARKCGSETGIGLRVYEVKGRTA